MQGRTQIHRFGHQAMATLFEVLIDGADRTYAAQAAQAVFHEVDRLETLLTRFSPSSDVSQVNRLEPGESIRVTYDLFECLRIAQEVHAKTDGAFDVTIGSLVSRMRDSQGQPRDLTESERASALARVGMKRLILDPGSRTVTLQKTEDRDCGGRMSVDLGGIGKGYALDRGAEILEDWGIESALLHSGTSTAVAIGAPSSPEAGDDQGWVLGAGAEWDQAAGFGTVRLKDEAISGSGKRVRAEHVLDPRSGLPVRGHLAAWAIAPGGALADALSTAFLVMSPSDVIEICKSMENVAGLVVVKRSGVLGAFKEEAIPSPGFRARSVARKAT
jgi:FAD:protein FMN transferase